MNDEVSLLCSVEVESYPGGVNQQNGHPWPRQQGPSRIAGVRAGCQVAGVVLC